MARLSAPLPFIRMAPPALDKRWLPLELLPDGPVSLPALLADCAGDVLAVLDQCGAILFRGFPDKGAAGFHDVIESFGLAPFTYAESLSNAVRKNRSDRVFTANEAPPDLEIYLHHEMAQTPRFPRYLFFYCERAAAAGGATPLCRSDHLLELLEQRLPGFIGQCRRLGVRYTHTMPGQADPVSGQGRSWRDTLAVTGREDAEKKLHSLGYRWVWRKDEDLQVTSPPLPAVLTTPSGIDVFFNQLVAAFAGWQDRRNTARGALTFGDGSAIAESDLEQLLSLAYSLVHDHAWQTGDMILIDNLKVMHGRRPFTGSRGILAGLALPSEH